MSDAVPQQITAGMRLRVTHSTCFHYEGEVLESHNEARLHPVSDPLQRCVEFALKVVPEVPVVTRVDFHQNQVAYFDVMSAHRRLEVASDAVVETRVDERGEAPSGLTLDALEGPEMDFTVFDFQNSSPLIAVTADAADEARAVIGPRVTDLWRDSVALARHVHETFQYVPGLTDSRTTVAEALKSRCGVCQDFANVTIALCRSRGIPARYVSGYFFNGKTEPSEVEASHAWMEVFLPGFGWKGWDPTHDRAADPRYIKLAVGRDYADVRPVSGRFLGKGSGSQTMTVEVRVRELKEPAAEEARQA
ncbi:MAG: transglutaminase family protein [Verrucomicrobiales bacterium]|nr:transglutaminase family protein [Verrucomicrobiales bacterium]